MWLSEAKSQKKRKDKEKKVELKQPASPFLFENQNGK